MKSQQNINKAIKFFEEGKIENAKKIALKTLKFEKNSVQLLTLLVMICGKLNDKISEKRYLLSLVKLSEDPATYQTLALLYQEENNVKQAKLYYTKALKLNPSYVKCYLYLSLIYTLEYDFVKAEELIFKAINLTKDTENVYESYHFLAVLYDKSEEYDKALEIYTELLRLKYGNSEMLFGLSLLYLKLGRYIEGFSFYRYRYHANKQGGQKLVQDIETLNKGIDIEDKHILILGEQGVGDVIQFIRYLPLYIEKKAKISVVVDESVLKLLANSYPEIELLNTIGYDKFDYSVLIGDSPYLFSSEYNSIPYQESYLGVSTKDSLLIYEKYFKDEKKNKVGIVWRSNRSDSANETSMLAKKREVYSMELKDYIKHFNRDNIQLYSLQVNTTKEEKELLKRNDIPSLGDDFASFYDNALVINNLDTVIAINTVSAHISAAMGKNTIIFVHDNSDWIWGTKGSSSCWYKSVTLMRQIQREGWESLMQRVPILL